MKLLEQSDIDSLLASAGGLASDASDGGAGTKSAAEEPRSHTPPPELPEPFVLKATPRELRRILPIKIPVTVRLAERSMSVAQILEFTVGMIIEFDRLADSELDLIAKNVPIGTGNAVKCGEKFGLRVIKIEPQARRLIAQGLYR